MTMASVRDWLVAIPLMIRSINQRKTDNTMSKIKMTKEQTMIYKTPHRKLKIKHVCMENTMLFASKKQFGFPIFWHWAYLMKVIPETHRANTIWYLRFTAAGLKIFKIVVGGPMYPIFPHGKVILHSHAHPKEFFFYLHDLLLVLVMNMSEIQLTW